MLYIIFYLESFSGYWICLGFSEKRVWLKTVPLGAAVTPAPQGHAFTSRWPLTRNPILIQVWPLFSPLLGVRRGTVFTLWWVFLSYSPFLMVYHNMRWWMLYMCMYDSYSFLHLADITLYDQGCLESITDYLGKNAFYVCGYILLIITLFLVSWPLIWYYKPFG